MDWLEVSWSLVAMLVCGGICILILGLGKLLIFIYDFKNELKEYRKYKNRRDNINKMTIGELLKNERERQKLTDYKLAKLANTSAPHLWDIENERVNRPSFEDVGKIAQALNLSLDEIYKQISE